VLFAREMTASVTAHFMRARAAAEDRVADELREHCAQGLNAETAARLATSSFARATLYDPDACAIIVGELAHALGLAADPPTTAPPAPELIDQGTRTPPPRARPTPQELWPAAAPLPAELKEALGSPYSRVRLGAVEELAGLALSSRPDLAQTARAMLKTLISDDSRVVSAAASAALAKITDVRPPAQDLAAQTLTRSAQRPPDQGEPTVLSRTDSGRGYVEIPRRLWVILAYVLPLVGVGSVLYVCLLVFCVVQVAKRRQPRIPVISRIARIPPRSASPELASQTTVSA
jgi:hypothetical protein